MAPSVAQPYLVSAGGSGQTNAIDAAIASDGAVYVVGSFSGTSTFGDHTIFADPDLVGPVHAYVAKLDQFGQWEWAVSGSEFAVYGVSATPDGAAVISGMFRQNATFGETTLTASDDGTAFAAKVSSSGEWLWATAPEGDARSTAWSVSAAPDGSAVVVGSFTGDLLFGGHQATTTASTCSDRDASQAFVARIDPDGKWMWVSSADGGGGSVGRDIAALSDGSVIVAGGYTGPTLFGDHAGSSECRSSLYTARLSPSGEWEWMASASGTRWVGGASVAVAAFPDGSAVVTGSLAADATFGSRQLTANALEDDDDFDVFVAKVSAGGDWLWATNANVDEMGYGNGIAALEDGSAIVTGHFRYFADFAGLTLGSRSSFDAYVANVSPSGQWEWVLVAAGSGFDLGTAVAAVAGGGAVVVGDYAGPADFGPYTLPGGSSSHVFAATVTAAGSFGPLAGGSQGSEDGPATVMAPCPELEFAALPEQLIAVLDTGCVGDWGVVVFSEPPRMASAVVMQRIGTEWTVTTTFSDITGEGSGELSAYVLTELGMDQTEAAELLTAVYIDP